MGFFSLLKLSLHSLLNNKLRTLLTIIVISVVSFVMVFLFGIVYSFYSSVNVNISNMINENGELINLSVREQTDRGYNMAPFGVDDIDKIVTEINLDEGYVDYISFFSVEDGKVTGNSSSLIEKNENVVDKNYHNYDTLFNVYPFYENSNPFIATDNYIAAGRMWNSADKGSLNIWLDSSAMASYELGDKIKIQHQTSYVNDVEKNDIIGEFTVAGFLEINSDNNYNGGHYAGQAQYYAFIPYAHFDDAYTPQKNDLPTNYVPKLQLNNMFIALTPQEGAFYGDKVVSYFSEMVKSLEQLTLQNGNLYTYGRIIETLEYVNLMTLVLLGVAAFISLIIILLSIGSVANTLKISAEQNRRFFGMMKAIGMKNKSLRSILTGQIVVMVLLGTIIAYGVSILLISSAYMIVESLATSMFYTSSVIEIICVISPIIPLCVALVFIVFVLLSSRSSLRHIVQMDVITVINEVN